MKNKYSNQVFDKIKFLMITMAAFVIWYFRYFTLLCLFVTRREGILSWKHTFLFQHILDFFLN